MEEEGRGARGAGGTRGGVGEFLLGLGMAVAGAYLLTQRVTVTGGYWTLWGYNAFGLSLLPLLFGIGLLFFDGRSVAGWLLTFAGAVIILVGVIANLGVYFAVHTLFARTRRLDQGVLAVELPEVGTIRPVAVAIALVAAVLLFRWKWSVLRTLGVCAVLGLVAGITGLPVT